MKILVLGASGMAGHTISLYFKEKGYDVTGYSSTPLSMFENIIGNAFDTNRFKEVLTEKEYDVIINCIGILNEFAENNPSKAVYLNTYIPHLIRDTLQVKNTKLIHLSTDCVFAGNTGPYFEHSVPDGKKLYDRTKALGEINDDKNLTFRTSIIGPDIKKSGIGLFNWFMKQNDSINGYTNVFWTGVTTLTMAQAMECAIKENLTGLYHLVNNERISKFDLLSLFNNYFKGNKIIINKSNEFNLDKSLINSRLSFSFDVPSYNQMVKEMKFWIMQHTDLYPHYLLYT